MDTLRRSMPCERVVVNDGRSCGSREIDETMSVHGPYKGEGVVENLNLCVRGYNTKLVCVYRHILNDVSTCRRGVEQDTRIIGSCGSGLNDEPVKHHIVHADCENIPIDNRTSHCDTSV